MSSGSASEPDDFYDYRKFGDERLKQIMVNWDGFRGNHGATIKFCASLLVGDSILDVGCGLCHLYKTLENRVAEYVGVDVDKRVLEWARQRYPNLELRRADVYDLSVLGDRRFDTVYAIGLYRRPHETRGIIEMLKHTRRALVLTYLYRAGSEPRFFPDVFWEALKDKRIKSLEFFNHNIKAIEIVRFRIS